PAVVRTRSCDRLLPHGAALRHEPIQRRLREHASQAGEVDGLVPVPPEQPARAGPEAHRTPSSKSSSTGSKNEHVPIEWNNEERTSTSRGGAASWSRQRNDVASRANAGARSRSASSSSPNTAAARRLRQPCSFSFGYA